ncbi:glycosyltransferase [Parvibaculum sedimenti]|uniref:Glycosyltransferase n=1 Tax=Parvibaculum sedimenti TaxID=2608632 RepID=A0A6N6VRV8_9HYPH|nr:glycosyltransferase family 4 protein [Parvibaculum sedimenti]KAB7742724.1 glycosyltransferase [Parvibaculum sedimenti]
MPIESGTDKAKPFKIALYTTYFAAGDGMGRVLTRKIAALDKLARTRPVELRIYCGGSDFDDPRICRVNKIPELIADPFFRTADIHHYEFGWYFRSFESIRYLPAKARASVFFHGITPPQWASDHKGALQSLKQKRLLFHADAVCAASHFARNDLVSFGIPAERIQIQPLPLSVNPTHIRAEPGDGPIELIHVARLTPNKGLIDLLKALEIASNRGLSFRLRVAAHPASASEGLLNEAQRRIESPALKNRVEFLGHIGDDDKLSSLYAQADALILPSYHDAYCLPVLEAFAHGCHVIAYDSTNLPYITNGLATLVPTGNIAALAEAIETFTTEAMQARIDNGNAFITTSSGPLPVNNHRQCTETYARSFSADRFESTFLAHIDALLATPHRRRSFLEHLRMAGFRVRHSALRNELSRLAKERLHPSNLE